MVVGWSLNLDALDFFFLAELHDLILGLVKSHIICAESLQHHCSLIIKGLANAPADDSEVNLRLFGHVQNLVNNLLVEQMT